MLKIYILIFYFIISFSLKGADHNGEQFLSQLKKWNIDYMKMNDFKAGAACIPKKNGSYVALGLSHSLAKLNYAKKVAIEGCISMMKKNKILFKCNCEVIFINNSFIERK